MVKRITGILMLVIFFVGGTWALYSTGTLIVTLKSFGIAILLTSWIFIATFLLKKDKNN